MTLTRQIAELDRLDRLAAAYSRYGWPTWFIDRTPTGFKVDAHGVYVDHEFVRPISGDPDAGVVCGTGDTFAEAVADANAKLIFVLAHLDTVGGAA